MLATGTHLLDDEVPESTKPKNLKGDQLLKTARVVGHLVNLLTIEQFQEKSYFPIIAQLEMILAEKKLLTLRGLTEETLSRIRAHV